MSTPAPPPLLLGRRTECAALDQLVARVREGLSRAIVIRGEAGVGKSALLDYLVLSARGCRIARAAGVESEMELAYAGIHQLCSPFFDRVERLPDPQRDALAAAFGLREGGAPDRFLVGLALLSLLSDVAEEQPLICVVDDAQWLDAASAQALAFVARRLGAESVGLVFARRVPGAAQHLEGLPELVVAGLEDSDARELLAATVAGPLDERVRDLIVAETRGNPLALLELPRGRTPAELAGGFGLADAPALSGRIEQSFLERLAPLPPATRELLLVAAAEPVGDPLPVWKAAAALGVDAGAAATAADLLEIGAQVRFRHPLVRSAVYDAAKPEDRQRVHRALAEATDAALDPDRRAWHRAHATAGLDEEVAAELEQSADRARARGGLAAEAAFHERAAQLTPDPEHRALRALAAAQSKHRAGASEAALRLLAIAEAGPLGELDSARAQLLHAQITFAATRGRDAPPLLIEAAKRLESLDAGLARATYLDAFAAALSADRLVSEGDVREVAAAVLSADWGESTSSAARDLLLEGLAVLTTEGYSAGAPMLKTALRAFRDEPLPEEEELRWLWLACHIARALCDDEAWDALTARQVELTRRAGAFAMLPVALDDRFTVDLFTGRIDVATSLAAEADAVIEATGSHLTVRTKIALAGWHGNIDEALALTKARQEDVVRRGEGLWVRANDWGLAVCYNGLGRYDEALAAAERAATDPHGLGVPPWILSDLVEAAARSGHPERAAGAVERLTEMAAALDNDFAHGVSARSRALLTEGDTAEALHAEGIERLARTRVRVALARARLNYGEWLRRENRRVDAREQLRAAHEMLSEMGMNAFAERARRELVATGETVRKRSAETRDDLTPQEAQIARLATEGLTNPEIGAQLFLSPRTVEWHLRKVFGKLGISSRRQLPSALADGGAAAPLPA